MEKKRKKNTNAWEINLINKNAYRIWYIPYIYIYIYISFIHSDRQSHSYNRITNTVRFKNLSSNTEPTN